MMKSMADKEEEEEEKEVEEDIKQGRRTRF
jgi:hypothetical protein